MYYNIDYTIYFFQSFLIIFICFLLWGMRFEVSFLIINIMWYKQKVMHMTITNHDKIELFEYSQNISSRLKCNQISTTKCVSWNEYQIKSIWYTSNVSKWIYNFLMVMVSTKKDSVFLRAILLWMNYKGKEFYHSLIELYAI